ncbi:alpha/beta fold hydrolase [Novosphingobium panipatense]|uniref:alpha/beta fold hydrolase n=1 Tax=Novosphingobium panipatense TaxID=428991 RepID=UPI003609E2EC
MSRRQPLVLVPGLTCDAEVWRGQVAGLSDVADMTVADTLEDDTIAAMAERLLDEAPDRFALAGFSMGATWRWRPSGGRLIGSRGSPS